MGLSLKQKAHSFEWAGFLRFLSFQTNTTQMGSGTKVKVPKPEPIRCGGSGNHGEPGYSSTIQPAVHQRNFGHSASGLSSTICERARKQFRRGGSRRPLPVRV